MSSRVVDRNRRKGGKKQVKRHIIDALRRSERRKIPYETFHLSEVLSPPICSFLSELQIEPPVLGNTDGTRDSYNDKRLFITPEIRTKYSGFDELAQAFQRPDVAHQFEKTLGIKLINESYLRMEYIQDTDGMWLEPHRDVPDKLFSMVLYLCTGPEAKDWGTDIYDDQKRWVGRSQADFNTAVIFRAGPNTWHGFEPRPIIGIRRLMEINYVQNWRDIEQLSFPDEKIIC